MVWFGDRLTRLASKAITFATSLSLGTLNIGARVTNTIAIFADAAFSTGHTFAGIGDALTFDTLFTGVASNRVAITGLTGIFDTLSIFAMLLGLAFDTSTRRDALAFATEFTRGAGHTIARITDTLAFFADFTFVEAAFDIAIIVNTDTS